MAVMVAKILIIRLFNLESFLIKLTYICTVGVEAD